MTSSDYNLSTEYEKLDLKCFEYTEHKPQDIENDIDPENNFYINTHSHCEYYTEEQFRKSVKMDRPISIIHFNSRSLNSNFEKKQLQKSNTV